MTESSGSFFAIIIILCGSNLVVMQCDMHPNELQLLIKTLYSSSQGRLGLSFTEVGSGNRMAAVPFHCNLIYIVNVGGCYGSHSSSPT